MQAGKPSRLAASIPVRGDRRAPDGQARPQPDEPGEQRIADRRMTQAFINLRRQVRAGRAALAALDCELIEVTARGRLRGASARARSWLGRYLGAMGNSLPANLRRWVQRERTALASVEVPSARPHPRLAANEAHALVVRHFCCADRAYFLLERPRSTIGTLGFLGLTARENQVLAWLADGKSNADIGVILGVSRRTVGKHVEHIFVKLGVESRVAAARRAILATREINIAERV